MNKNIQDLIRSFVSLNGHEKSQVINLIKTLETGTSGEKRMITESIGMETFATNVNFAPTPGSCPTCGK
jgi:hypothetical protein